MRYAKTIILTLTVAFYAVIANAQDPAPTPAPTPTPDITTPVYHISTEIIGTGGIIDPPFDNIKEGYNKNIRAKPDKGYIIKSFRMDDTELVEDGLLYKISRKGKGIGTYKMKDIRANHHFTAEFILDPNPTPPKTSKVTAATCASINAGEVCAEWFPYVFNITRDMQILNNNGYEGLSLTKSCRGGYLPPGKARKCTIKAKKSYKIIDLHWHKCTPATQIISANNPELDTGVLTPDEKNKFSFTACANGGESNGMHVVLQVLDAMKGIVEEIEQVEGGTVTPRSKFLANGKSRTFRFKANLGYYIDAIWLDDIEVTRTPSFWGNFIINATRTRASYKYTMQDNTQQHIFKARFLPIPISHVATTITGNGTITPDSFDIQQGKAKIFAITATAPSYISGITLNDVDLMPFTRLSKDKRTAKIRIKYDMDEQNYFLRVTFTNESH